MNAIAKFAYQGKQIKTYEWVLFDADDTLFHFDAFIGLRLMLAKFGVNFTNQDYQEYQTVNKSLWTDYQNGHITIQQLKHQRFNAWAEKLQVSSYDLNSAFLSAMAEISTPLEGAVSLLNALKGKSKLGMITNGFTELQQVRLERHGLRDYFELLITSEQVGIAKPHRGIFDYAFSIMNNPPHEKVLMVGDTLESDILGGLNAGLDTCWLNIHNKPASETITPQYQVASLQELENLLLGKKGEYFNETR